MRKIKFLLLLSFLSTYADAQGEKKNWFTTTNLIGSYYHLGSYSKERPFAGIEQLVEYAAFEKFRFGLGTGFNLYPANATIPIYITARFITPMNDKWSFYILQSYGRNIKTGKIGFNSNRIYTDFGAPFHINQKFSINPSMGALMNWDKWGGKSLSFTGGLGLTINLD